ncbi:MAG: cupin domain-containing protein [Acidimicrobiales bacterium]
MSETSNSIATNSIGRNPIHLGLGATAVVQPEFTGEMNWYQSYGERTAEDGIEGRLVAMHTFTESWDMWEMHPNGSEVVLCVDGEVTLHQRVDDATSTAVQLGPGEYAINEPGMWHTADVTDEATVVFITAGMGTEHRPR